MATMNSKKIMPWIISILIVSALILGLSPIIKYQLEKNLSAILSQPVTIETLNFNPFVGTANIEGIQISKHTSLARALINIEIWPLLQQHLHIQSLVLSEGQLPIKSVHDRLTVAGYLIEGTDSPADGETFRLSIEALILNKIDLEVEHETSTHQIKIESLSLGTFDTAQSYRTPLRTSLAANGGQINLEGHFSAQASEQNFIGEIKIEIWT